MLGLDDKSSSGPSTTPVLRDVFNRQSSRLAVVLALNENALSLF